MKYILTSEGKINYNKGLFAYEYFLKYHLGNTQVTMNSNGTVSQVADYFPFGMRHEPMALEDASQKYLYNGKELKDETGLYDYGARMYDAALGRWHVIDAMASSYYDYSPYHYSGNNPILFKDVDGRYYVGTDGKPVVTTVNDNGKIQLSSNASADLQRMASMTNESGSSKAVAQFAAVGNNETKVNFKISQEVVFPEGGGVLLGLHQAHDVNGNALSWDSESGTFDGEVAFKTDADGNLIYEEATVTIYEKTIEIVAGENKESEMVVTNAHENEHDLNTKDIEAIKERGEGKSNNRNVEVEATKVEEKVRKEIKENGTY